MRNAWVWLIRPGIGRRIALAMIVSLLAVQAQAIVQLRIFTTFQAHLTGTRYLAETVAEEARAVFAAPPDRRAAILKTSGEGISAQFEWGQAHPVWPGDAAAPVTARLAATLRVLLGAVAQDVEVTLSPLDYVFPVRALQFEIVPGNVVERLGVGPVRADEPDVLIPASVRIAVQGQDGSWISVVPVSFVVSGIPFFSAPVIALAAGALIITALAALTARRIMAPLNRLLLAVNRLGASREIIALADAKLGEFAPVAQAFEDMQHRLLRLVDDRTQMLAAISHDLRSALTRLRIAAEACEGEAERQAVVTEVEEMRAMVESTLAFASGEARMTPSRHTDLAALLISLVDEAADSGWLCTYDGPDHAELMAHPVALKRAFTNLIDNAVKYGGIARVYLAHDDGRLMVRIEDDGPGIPPHQVEDAFAPFRRLDPARNTNVSGVGLGLAIARDVVRSHGGVIALEGKVGHGLVVQITLPALSGDRALQ